MTRKVVGKDGKGGSRGPGSRILAALTPLCFACDRAAPPPPDHLSVPPPPQPAPRLALKTSSGVEVWFGDAREGRDSAGGTCVERTLEIRGANGRRIVPLLYTLETPTVLDDTTIRARLFTGCRPGPVYRVDLRTGLPVREDR